jgi:hypothetical protein
MTEYDELYTASGRSLRINPPPYSASASFRIFHEDLDPKVISTAFGMSPTKSHYKGEPRDGRNGRVYTPHQQGIWILSSKNQFSSVDANTHICWVLDQLVVCIEEIHQFQDQGFNTDMMCGWHTEGWNTCPALNVKTMRMLTRFRLDCWFDIYSN